MPKLPATFRPISRPREQANRDYDARRTAHKPWRRWYWSQRWRNIAKDHLAREPLCRMCAERGDVVPATHCDHVIPHHGDPALFWEGERQSLCETCHNRDKQREEARHARATGGAPFGRRP